MLIYFDFCSYKVFGEAYNEKKTKKKRFAMMFDGIRT